MWVAKADVRNVEKWVKGSAASITSVGGVRALDST